MSFDPFFSCWYFNDTCVCGKVKQIYHFLQADCLRSCSHLFFWINDLSAPAFNISFWSSVCLQRTYAHWSLWWSSMPHTDLNILQLRSQPSNGTFNLMLFIISYQIYPQTACWVTLSAISLTDPHLYQLPVLLLRLWQVTLRYCFPNFWVPNKTDLHHFFSVYSVAISRYNVNLFHHKIRSCPDTTIFFLFFCENRSPWNQLEPPKYMVMMIIASCDYQIQLSILVVKPTVVSADTHSWHES